MTMIDFVLVPQFSFRDISGDARAWHGAMAALFEAIAQAVQDGPVGVALPQHTICDLNERDQAELRKMIEQGRVRLMPWLLWPVPTGLPMAAINVLGFKSGDVVHRAWRQLQEVSGAPAPSPWVDLPSVHEPVLSWQLLPVQRTEAGHGTAVSSLHALWHPSLAAERLLEAQRDASGSGITHWLHSAWVQLSRLLSGAGGPWQAAPEPGQWHDFESAFSETALRQTVGAAVPPQNDSLHRRVSLKNDRAALSISPGGQVHAAFEGGERFHSLIDYVLCSPQGVRKRRGLPHRISVHPDSVGIRVRMPLPGSNHGHRPPVKLWTALALDEDGRIQIITRFEDLPLHTRLILRLPLGAIDLNYTVTGPYGTFYESATSPQGHWRPNGESMQFLGKNRVLHAVPEGWPVHRLLNEGRRTLELGSACLASSKECCYSGQFKVFLSPFSC